MNNLLSHRNWRYATKKFDSDKQVPEEKLEQLLEAIRLSASSFGLQPYTVIVVKDPEVKAQLKPASWDQQQITQASHILVFAIQVDFDDSLVDNYMTEVSKTRNQPMAEISGYGDFMKSALNKMNTEQKDIWASKQIYIALGNALNAAAELALDACPMEGFIPEKYDEILNLKEQGLRSTVIMPVGYRAHDDATQHQAKVRKPKETLYQFI